MACRRLREMIDSNTPAFGLWVSLADPAVVEIAAYAGYDYVNIDMEHTALDLGVIENMLRAAHSCGISALVRVPENNRGWIQRAAEIGPDGLFIPHVRNAEDARQAVIAAKYPPVGDRGISGSTRAASYGSGGDFNAYAEAINRDFIIHAQIEDLSAVEDIEAIAAVEGLDVCGTAPSDLARTMGVMGTKNDARTGEAIKKVAAAIRKVGKAKLAVPIMHPNYLLDTADVVELGAVMISASSATKTLLAGLTENIRKAREKLPKGAKQIKK
jgi:2-keto-3-deoxy-L-rhamnonate aldolase RhmA